MEADTIGTIQLDEKDRVEMRKKVLEIANLILEETGNEALAISLDSRLPENE